MKTFLGLVVVWMNTSKSPWTVNSIPLGCTEFFENHTSFNMLQSIQSVLNEFGLTEFDIIGVTQDTASNSFNTFDSIDKVQQLPCFAHLTNLMLKHGLGDGIMKEGFAAIHDVVISLRGSPKRRLLLIDACKKSEIKYIKPVKDGATRWNSNEMMIRIFFQLLPAIMIFDANEGFSSADDKSEWYRRLHRANTFVPLLKHILPFLTICAQWVQILSSNHQPTISLVRLACSQINRSIKKIKTNALELQDSDIAEEVVLGNNLKTCVVQLSLQFNSYLGEHLTDYYIYKVAECLDTRTFLTLSMEDLYERVELMESQGLCTDYEKTGRHESAIVATSNRGRGRGRGIRGGASMTTSLTPEEILQERLTGIPKSVPLLRLEFSTFVSFVKKHSEDGCEPLAFWGMHGDRFPILARIAAILLPISACSADVERLFSISGNICSPQRSSLSGKSIDTLTTLHYWLKEEYEYTSRKDRSRMAKDKRFTTLQVDLQILDGQEDEATNNEGISDDDF
jgi:hypothetical protein